MVDVASIKGKLQGLIPSFGAKSPDDAPVTPPFKKALIEGTIAGAVIMVVLLGWMMLRASDTAEKLQPLIPVKTASIEKPEKPVSKPDPNSPSQKALGNAKNINALPQAPIEGLFETVDGRTLPKSRFEDDLTPFEAYKKPFKATGQSLVSIVVVDYGLSETISQSLLDNMPADISFVMNPYTGDPARWASAARAYGHEFWISLPMQTKDTAPSDVGPDALVLNGGLPENKARLQAVMGVASGYAGLVSEKDHIFKPDDIDVAPSAQQIFGRGLAFAESNPDIPAFGLSYAMQEGSPYVQNNFWLDGDLRPETIDRLLQMLEIQAVRKGKVVAFMHPYPIVVNKVQDWARTLEAKNIQMAPLSAMVQ